MSLHLIPYNILAYCEKLKISTFSTFWKLMIFESQYHFANISATKARIFMKFETEAHKIVMNYQNNFHENPCIHTQAICMVMKIFSVFHYYFMSLSLKCHKGWSFCYGNICKMVVTFKNINFYFIFYIFTVTSLNKCG